MATAFDNNQRELEVGQKKVVMSIDRYRQLSRDQKTPDKIIEERVKYIEMICRDSIRQTLDQYEKTL